MSSITMDGSFVYDIPTKVYFGRDKLNNLGRELAAYGKRVLLCYGVSSAKENGMYERVVKEIEAAGLTLFELPGFKLLKQQDIENILRMCL